MLVAKNAKTNEHVPRHASGLLRWSRVPVAPPVPYGAPGHRQRHMAPYGAIQRARVQQSAAFQGMPWPSQPTPYASAFMAPSAWPVYMPSYMPWPMQAEFEELARQHQDLMARELEVQRMTRTCNLNAVRAAGATTTASVAGSKRSHKKEQAPSKASSQIASRRSQTPSGAPPSGISVTQTAASLLSILRMALAMR